MIPASTRGGVKTTAKKAATAKRRKPLGAMYSTHASTATRQSDLISGDGLSLVKYDVLKTRQFALMKLRQS